MDSFPSSELLRPVTQSEIASFASDGVVYLPNIVEKGWIELLNSSLELMLKDPKMFADLTALSSDLNKTQGLAAITENESKAGRFLSGVDHWKEDKNFAAFAKISPLPSIVAKLMNSKTVYLYEDSVCCLYCFDAFLIISG